MGMAAMAPMAGKGMQAAMGAVGGGKKGKGGGQQAQGGGGGGGGGGQGGGLNLSSIAQMIQGGGGGQSGGGGSTPQQQALTDYMAGQQILGAQGRFAEHGTGHSTMAKYAARSAAQPDPAQMAQQRKQQDKSLADLASGAGFQAGYSGA